MPTLEISAIPHTTWRARVLGFSFSANKMQVTDFFSEAAKFFIKKITFHPFDTEIIFLRGSFHKIRSRFPDKYFHRTNLSLIILEKKRKKKGVDGWVSRTRGILQADFHLVLGISH